MAPKASSTPSPSPTSFPPAATVVTPAPLPTFGPPALPYFQAPTQTFTHPPPQAPRAVLPQPAAFSPASSSTAAFTRVRASLPVASGGKRSTPPYTKDKPAKKHGKWLEREDALIIELRDGGMRWEDIAKRLPGRTMYSCRTHYQNILALQGKWTEKRKNKLARLYERNKFHMWTKVAREMHVPWRAAEAMHWQLGEADMAQRAGVTPHSPTTSAVETSSSSHHHHRTPTHAPYQHQQMHSHHHSKGDMRGNLAGGSSGCAPPLLYGRGGSSGVPLPPPSQPPSMHGDRGIPGLGPRSFGGPGGRQERGGTPGRSTGAGSPSDPINNMYYYPQRPQQQPYQYLGPSLPPIQTSGPLPPHQQERVGSSATLPLPSLTEITTGVSPFSTPAYSIGTSPGPIAAESSGPISNPQYTQAGMEGLSDSAVPKSNSDKKRGEEDVPTNLPGY